MLLHGEPCITSGIYCITGVADRVHLYKYIGIYCITGGRTCINSRLLIAINWQNWVKLPPASLLWLLHRRTTHCLTATTLPYILHLLHRATCYSATSSYVLQGATVVLDFTSAQAQCDEAGIRQIASWETPRASQGPMGASGTRADLTWNHDVMCPGYIFGHKM